MKRTGCRDKRIIDILTEREAVGTRAPISGRRVTRELTILVGCRGKPGMTVGGNGTDRTGDAIPR